MSWKLDMFNILKCCCLYLQWLPNETRPFYQEKQLSQANQVDEVGQGLGLGAQGVFTMVDKITHTWENCHSSLLLPCSVESRSSGAVNKIKLEALTSRKLHLWMITSSLTPYYAPGMQGKGWFRNSFYALVSFQMSTKK